ncbi:MAG: hypothetical protein OXI50_14415 [Gammaproteobacteria bacterium]|nr:hypothetical protein [Gammaproteobacteria bacterium]
MDTRTARGAWSGPPGQGSTGYSQPPARRIVALAITAAAVPAA